MITQIRKIFIFAFLVFFSFNAYSFWIWSPKTQKWKNPKYSPLATPFLQFKEAEKYFNEKLYKEAHREFKKLLINYPDSKEAAEAQYYLGRCLEEMNQPYAAFLEYQKVIESYPNSKRINEIVEREYNIGEYFLNREPKKWLGVSLYDLVEHPSIEILRKIVDKTPYSPCAPKAQYKLGLLFMQLGRYEEAKDAFQKVIDSYPENEWASPARYQLAIATSKASYGTDYDSSSIQEATKRLDEFIKKHPDAQISEQAIEQLKELRNKEAKKNFDIAQFYETQGQYKSALVYYNIVIDKYSDCTYHKAAQEKAKELDELIKGNITKKDFIKQKIEEEREEKRGEDSRLREEKLLEKQQKIEEKRKLKEQLKEQKKSEKEELIRKRQELKGEKKEEKQKLLEQKKKKQEELAEQKRRKKEELLRKKRELKEKKKQEKQLISQRQGAKETEKKEVERIKESLSQGGKGPSELIQEDKLLNNLTEDEVAE